ncbi:MAG TPA: DUF5069 domain-containing protein [Chthoniobacterales bacterium]
MATTYPRSPKDEIKGMTYFPRMLDKIRLHARGELHEDYHKNLGAPRTADSACCNFLRVNHADLIERVKQGGSDEEILEWCFEKGRRPNEGDVMVWNAFVSKLGWRDFATPTLREAKHRLGIMDRNDIRTITDVIDFEEGRLREAPPAKTRPGKGKWKKRDQ